MLPVNRAESPPVRLAPITPALAPCDFRISSISSSIVPSSARAAGLLLLRAMKDSGLDLVQWIRRVEDSIDGKEPGKHARGGLGPGPLSGEVIVFTGRLDISREAAAQIASTAGCEVADTVSQRTTILVVGDQDLRLTKGQEKSSKHRKAEGLVAKGGAIKIVGESDFKRLVNADR
jgi:DNA polymerase-3 subunit epsilon